MPSSRPDSSRRQKIPVQMGLDFIQENQYIITHLEGGAAVEAELFEKLEKKISDLLARYSAIKEENLLLTEENKRLQQDREGLKGRIDAILNKLEGV